VGVALLLSPQPTKMRFAIAGLALGFATSVRASNAVFAVIALLLVFGRDGMRLAVPYGAGAAILVPVVLAFYPKSYPLLWKNPRVTVEHPFSDDHLLIGWTKSLIFTPRMLLVLLPLLVIGAIALRRRFPLAVLGTLILSNAIFYSFYWGTAGHPRFLYVALPAVFVLEATGALTVLDGVQRVIGSRWPRARVGAEA
jgi:hypothetical protein